MSNDIYKLNGKSNSELHEWLAGHESSSVEYLAGIRELMERNDAPVSRREWMAMTLAIVVIAVTIIVVIVMFE